MSVAVLSRLPLEAADFAAPSPQPGRMLQLDGIRGLAVAGVMAWHWLPQYEYLRYCPLGMICVRVFFALSGFLITGILLRARRENEETGGRWWAPVRHFFIRRTLRIFPLYYAVLLVIVVGGVQAARENVGWHFFYLSNVLSAISNGGGGSTSHFWSLAVEEQFYLVWPWLMLFLPRRALPWVIGSMLVAGPVCRLMIYQMTNQLPAATVLPFGCLDSLGAGALLAWAAEVWRGDAERREALNRFFLSAGVPLMVLALALYNVDNVGIGWVLVMDLGVGFTTAWVISRASTGFGGPLGRLLQWQPLLWLGTVSYCVYIIHPFVHNLTPYVLDRLHLPDLRLRYHLLMDAALTLGIASVSWVCFERPLIRWGRWLTPERGRDAVRV